MKGSLGFLLIGLLLAACTGAQNPADPPAERVLAVETLTLGEVQRNPPQITAIMGGFQSACERLETWQRREDETFYLTVIGIPKAAACPAVTVAYTQTVMLDLWGVEAGMYTVKAGDQSATFTEPANEYLTSEPEITAVDVVVESDPARAVAYITGNPLSSCDQPESISQRRTLRTFYITVVRKSPSIPGIQCAPGGSPFTERVTLETQDLAPGTYQVDVNGMIENFTLP